MTNRLAWRPLRLCARNLSVSQEDGMAQKKTEVSRRDFLKKSNANIALQTSPIVLRPSSRVPHHKHDRLAFKEFVRRRPMHNASEGNPNTKFYAYRLILRLLPRGQLLCNSSGRIGSFRMRLPVAAKMALVTAGASGGTPGSPIPPAAA